MEAIHTEGIVRVDDLLTDWRWGSFGQEAGPATGVRSVLAHGLRAGGRTIGALNLYSTRPSAFDDGPSTGHICALFASHAAVALLEAKRLEDLRAALETREAICVAMGILMGRQNISKVQAFSILRRASQRENVKLRIIAARIAGNDILPESTTFGGPT